MPPFFTPTLATNKPLPICIPILNALLLLLPFSMTFFVTSTSIVGAFLASIEHSPVLVVQIFRKFLAHLLDATSLTAILDLRCTIVHLSLLLLLCRGKFVTLSQVNDSKRVYLGPLILTVSRLSLIHACTIQEIRTHHCCESDNPQNHVEPYPQSHITMNAIQVRAVWVCCTSRHHLIFIWK